MTGPATGAAIAIAHVSKRFPRVRACDDITFDIPTGATFGLLGPNGAGKTTLFSIIAGFLRPTSGHVAVLGIDTRRISALRGRLSILPQDAQFAANIPVIEQIIFFGELNGRTRADAESDAMAALAKVGLTDVATSSARTLSHGMYKRLGIAQAFLGNPEVVLLDEPTAGLDPVNAAQVRELVRALKRAGATLVISSHDLAEIQQLCDAVAIVDHGKLVTCSSVKDLTQANTVVRMTFARALTDAELAAIRGVGAVRGVDQDGDHSYRVLVEASGAPLDEITNAIVATLVPTGAVPRKIEDGVALEQKYLELMKR